MASPLQDQPSDIFKGSSAHKSTFQDILKDSGADNPTNQDNPTIQVEPSADTTAIFKGPGANTTASSPTSQASIDPYLVNIYKGPEPTTVSSDPTILTNPNDITAQILKEIEPYAHLYRPKSQVNLGHGGHPEPEKSEPPLQPDPLYLTQITGIMKTGGFLNAEDIRNLINANTDENAPHFIFMTVHGTIFGHDKDQDIKDIRKFGAFAGTTWLRHDKAISETGKASTEPDFGLDGRTLKVVTSKDGTTLRSMIVQVDDMIGAICYVKEKTLLAAQMEKRHFIGETDEIATMFLDPVAEKAADTGAPEAEAGSIANPGEVEPEMANEEGASPQNEATASSVALPNGKPSKVRILEIRAEAMAKEFAEEICGPEFRMPPEFV